MQKNQQQQHFCCNLNELHYVMHCSLLLLLLLLLCLLLLLVLLLPFTAAKCISFCGKRQLTAATIEYGHQCHALLWSEDSLSLSICAAYSSSLSSSLSLCPYCGQLWLHLDINLASYTKSDRVEMAILSTLIAVACVRKREGAWNIRV